MTRNPSAAEPPFDVALPAGGTAGGVADVCAHAMPSVVMVHPLGDGNQQRRCHEGGRHVACLPPATPMRVVIEGLGDDRVLRTLVTGKVSASLSRLHVPATTARVQFASETGAKGGATSRCSITVDLPRRPELHADVSAESVRLAFEHAFAMLERQVERDRARRREDRRRPKKYY